MLAALSLAVAVKVGRQLVHSLAPVRVPAAGTGGRAGADWRLYAKSGRAPGCSRLAAALSLLAAVLACAPAWWRLTQVPRALLPLRELREAALLPGPPLVLRLHALRVRADGGADASAEAELLAQRSAALTAEYHVHVSASLDTAAGCSLPAEAEASSVSAPAPPAPTWRCGLALELPRMLALSDAQLDAWLAGWPGAEGRAGAYTLLLLPPATASEPEAGRLVFGSHRVAWVRGVERGIEANVAAAAARRWTAAGESAEAPPLGPGAVLHLDLVLCNVQPQRGHAFSWRWEGLGGLGALWLPVAEALQPLCRLRLGSAVRPHGCGAGAALGGVMGRAQPSGGEGWRLPADAAPQLLEAVRRGEEQAAAAPGGPPAERRLRLVALVPPALSCPLQLPGGAPGLVSPDWGGLVLWSPPGCGRSSNSTPDAGGSSTPLQPAQLRWLSALWVAQLRRLLGLPALPRSDELPSAAGFALWEVDVLQRRAGGEALAATSEALGTLERALAPASVPMSQVLGELTTRALRALADARRHAAGGRHSEAAGIAAEAHAAAEEASSHPSLLARLYFPSEYKLAIYLPLLLPSLLPLTLTVLRELHHLRKRRAFAAAFRLREAAGEAADSTVS